MHLHAPPGWSNSCSTSPLPQHCLWGRERVPFHALYPECCRRRTAVLHTGTWPPLELAVKPVLRQASLHPAEAQPHPHREELIRQGATKHSSLPSPVQQYRLARSWLQSTTRAYIQAVVSWVALWPVLAMALYGFCGYAVITYHTLSMTYRIHYRANMLHDLTGRPDQEESVTQAQQCHSLFLI